MTRSQKSRLAVWLTVAVAGALIGYFYTALSYPLAGPEAAPALRGMRAGFMIAAASGGFEIFAMRGRAGLRGPVTGITYEHASSLPSGSTDWLSPRGCRLAPGHLTRARPLVARRTP